jgi:hypothetical protein
LVANKSKKGVASAPDQDHFETEHQNHAGDHILCHQRPSAIRTHAFRRTLELALCKVIVGAGQEDSENWPLAGCRVHDATQVTYRVRPGSGSRSPSNSQFGTSHASKVSPYSGYQDTCALAASIPPRYHQHQSPIQILGPL